MHHSSCWVDQRVVASKDHAVILFARISLAAMRFLRGMQDTRPPSPAAGSGHPSGWGHLSGPAGLGSTPICQGPVCEPGWLALLGEAPRASSAWAPRGWGSGPSTAPCPPGPALPEPQGLFPGTPHPSQVIFLPGRHAGMKAGWAGSSWLSAHSGDGGGHVARPGLLAEAEDCALLHGVSRGALGPRGWVCTAWGQSRRRAPAPAGLPQPHGLQDAVQGARVSGRASGASGPLLT